MYLLGMGKRNVLIYIIAVHVKVILSYNRMKSESAMRFGRLPSDAEEVVL